MKQWKIGIIGFGGMASWHVKGLISKVENLSVGGVYDIDPERVRAAEALGLTGFGSLEAFLDSRAFDIVLVATPNNFHCELACRALEAGYHVICEKPAAMSVAELDQMTETADRCGKVFTVHQNRRWDSDFIKVKAALETGLVGNPYTIESCVHGGGGVMHGWRAYQVAGGGMMYDWGVHLIDQILQLYPDKKIQNVYCQMKSVKTPEVDDFFKLIFSIENGLDVQIEVGTYCLKQKPRWYINGDGGSLIIHSWDCKGEILHSALDGMEWEPEVVQTAAGPTRTMAPRPKESLSTLPLPAENGDSIVFYYNLLETLEGKAELFIKPSEIRRVLTVMEAGFWSAATGQAVELGI